MSQPVARPFRVLLYAHVDLNVIDGSAFFVAGAASLLTSVPGVVVDAVSAAPLKRAVVVEEMLGQPNVRLIDPFRDESIASWVPDFAGRSRMDETTAAAVLEYYTDKTSYDVVLVRSTATVSALVRRRPDLAPRTALYVTGVTAADEELSPALRLELGHLHDAGVTFLCQTPEMRDHLTAHTGIQDRIGIMSPAVPDGDRASAVPQPTGEVRLAYTGKFAPAWNTVEMLAGFKEAAADAPNLRLLVAGDHFKQSEDWKSFPAEVRYLLSSHGQITWLGAVPRERARDLLLSSHVGVSWRSRSLDSSLELSTKVLETGALGRPSILNPTAMHLRLFGPDYPLFASSMSQYVALLRRLAVEPVVVAEAAQTAMAVAQRYTYTSVFRELFPTLLRVAATGGTAAGADPVDPAIAHLLSTGRSVVVQDDLMVGWLRDPADAGELLAALDGSVGWGQAERVGPFFRCRLDEGTESANRGQQLALVVDALVESRASRSSAEVRAGDMTLSFSSGGRVGLVAGPAATSSASTAATASSIGGSLGDVGRTAAPVGTSPGPGGTGRHEPPQPPTSGGATTSELQELSRISERYDALAGSRLGRAQLAYWRLRRKVRSRARREV